MVRNGASIYVLINFLSKKKRSTKVNEKVEKASPPWRKINGENSFRIPLFCPWPIGYNEFDFFLENKEYRHFDGCKIEIYKIRFLIFWAVFFAFGFKVWKSTNMT